MARALFFMLAKSWGRLPHFKMQMRSEVERGRGGLATQQRRRVPPCKLNSSTREGEEKANSLQELLGASLWQCHGSAPGRQLTMLKPRTSSRLEGDLQLHAFSLQHAFQWRLGCVLD